MVPFTSGMAVFQPFIASMMSAPFSERCVPCSLYVESPKRRDTASQSALLNASTKLEADLVEMELSDAFDVVANSSRLAAMPAV